MPNNLANIDQIIQDAKNGKMFILIDDENRENEGDLVIPASFCNSEQVNFMATFGRGLICLALNSSRIEELSLPFMSSNNKSRNKTAFTISIEAKEGITTGISAFDRAVTIATAIDPIKTSKDIVSPGHIFPLKAEDGGVLVRAGHTEAAVDIAKLAGLYPAGVICEIMKDDGTMARMEDLIIFAKRHRLNIATIADLIEYRRKTEKLIVKIAEMPLKNQVFSNFKIAIYKNLIDNSEHLAIFKGELTSDSPTIVRMQHFNIFSDAINISESMPSNINKAMKIIDSEGKGVIVIIRQINESLENLIQNNNEKRSNNVLRSYGIGAQILNDLQINKLKLLTNNAKAVAGLDGYGIEIFEFINF
jgi:3,4-dihydroxy 2-butanone 4-phosphate synthase/GTP cyclohydrolase II